ncbi:MAG: PEP-utilizing enzyme [Gammaproteobacteria bacterium]|nr:PEP-utilizing enzyme [Gammaproteobacteria bacterium]
MQTPIKDIPDWIVDLEAESSVETIGSKAFNLTLLHKLGFAVPDCFFIPTFDPHRLKMKSTAEFLAAIEGLSRLLPLRLPSEPGWAVRSSATIEDLPGESHAGRFETVFITSPEEFTRAVESVWESGATANIGAESMGVVVQKLVSADFAGVAFSVDPTTQDSSTVVEGVPGNAARLVNGEVTPWRMRASEPTARLPSGFDQTTLDEIYAGVQTLAEEFNHAVDVEWALQGNRLYWLQVRPITGLRYRKFEVPTQQREQLSGLWARINHSVAPQAPLVISLNPGGYFDGPGWESCLVNGFHYVRKDKDPKIELTDSEYDQNLIRWDETEKRYTKVFDDSQQRDLGELSAADLWNELQHRITLNRDYFGKYTDYEFLHIRKQTEQAVTEFIRTASGPETPPEPILVRLLAQLGTLTEAKQSLLFSLAELRAENPLQDIQDTRQWAEFIESYGFESATTQLYYLPTLRETPDLIIAMLDQLALLTPGPIDLKNWQAEADSVANKLGEDQRNDFMDKLLRLRRCLLRTENDDYLLQKGTMLVRDAILSAGDRLADGGIIGRRDDVFYLTGEELYESLVESKHRSLHRIVEERSREFADNKLLSPPPLIINGRPVIPKSKNEGNALIGTPASPGVANGTVVVLNDPFSCMGKQLPRNAVIVAPIVTPSLAYSLIGCAALVTEAGGLASHGAIVAREMGIPAVVGISTARARLVTGMPVTVDGTRGEVLILDSPKI